MDKAKGNRSRSLAQGFQARWLIVAAACALFWAGSSVRSAAQTAADPQGNTQNGRALYTSKNCSQCHGPSGAGTAAGPSLLTSSATFTTFLNQLRHPSDKMPAVPESSVTDAQVADLYAFVGSLKAGGASGAGTSVAGNAENGKRIFTAYGCYECHGYMAQGASTGPRLGPHPIPLANVINELRHPNQMPPYTAKVISDTQIADIYAFLQSLPEPPKLDSIPILNEK